MANRAEKIGNVCGECILALLVRGRICENVVAPNTTVAVWRRLDRREKYPGVESVLNLPQGASNTQYGAWGLPGPFRIDEKEFFAIFASP